MADHPIRATLAGVLLFVIGLAIGGGAFMNYSRERERLLAWVRTDGEVVQLLTSADGKPRPIVGFRTNSGDRIRFTATGPGAGRSFRVGDRVAVLYPAADPSAARIDTPAIRWARSMYAAAGSVILMALGGYIAWFAKRRGMEPPAEQE